MIVVDTSVWVAAQRHPAGEIARAADAGQRFAITDPLIARLADDVGGLLWSLDSDFERLARLKLVRLYGS